MSSRLIELFEDMEVVKRIQTRLPYFFQVAELESSRAGKVGMEVGTVREKIIIALLVFKFGEKNVETNIPINEPEVDVMVFNQNVSIKTISGNTFSGVKLIWTVDAHKAEEFRNKYSPQCDILLVQVNWDYKGGLFYIPLQVQQKIFERIGKEEYIRLPKAGTNPRGVEMTKQALSSLVMDENTKSIEIQWEKKKIDYNPYERWLDYWRK